jgi:HTH-type transcriptional regulator/antitoxin HigA
MTIQPIRNKRDYVAALKRIERLWGAPVGTAEGDELDVLSTLVAAYEEQHYPVPPPDPVAAILFRMEQQGLTRRDLEPLIGSRARVSEVLGGSRRLTLPMIRRLNAELKIPADILIGTSEVRATASRTRASRRKSSPTPRVQPQAQRPVRKQSPAATRSRAA